MKRKRSASDWVLDGVIFLTMAIMVACMIYPFLNALAISLNDSQDTLRGGITVYPRIFTWQNYKQLLRDESIYRAYFITISRTVLGTLSCVFFTALFAYGMSDPKLMGRRLYNILSIIPMYITGGLIPTYLWMRELGLMNNFLVYIIPGMIDVWYMILIRTYFRGLPAGLEESALIDGAGRFTIFFKIVLPLSTPIIATISLFCAVQHWNAWFDASLYITRADLKPIQTVLMNVVNSAKNAKELMESQSGASAEFILARMQVNERSLTMAMMIITVLPIIMVYPFVQRFFTKGMMVGSLKG